jgi:hypothetical protein
MNGSEKRRAVDDASRRDFAASGRSRLVAHLAPGSSGFPGESCYCPGTFPGCLALLIGAEPIECTPGWPVLEEQALTNRPVSSSATAASDMVIFFFIYCFLVCCSVGNTYPFPMLISF